MKLITTVFFGSILLFSCTIPQVYKTGNNTSFDIPLMPFYKDGCFGYVNSETFEIVITEQYKTEGNFNGKYAIVEKREGKPFIINKNNVEILGGFDRVVLFNTEDNKMTFALTGNDCDRKLRYHSGDWFGFWRFDPENMNYRVYNLTTGKLVAEMGKREYSSSRESRNPKLYFFNRLV
ncbi:MAG: hypothetical protein LBK74_08005 [Treponema sp.]|jgi:hypothetical protein|nr:hypothetical protein [Treponema sp.]